MSCVVHVVAQNLLPQSELTSRHDRCVRGVYEIQMPHGVLMSQRAGALALDVFRRTVLVERPEEFNFCAADPASGLVLFGGAQVDSSAASAASIRRLDTEALPLRYTVVGRLANGSRSEMLGRVVVIASNCFEAVARGIAFLPRRNCAQDGQRPWYRAYLN